MDVEPPALARNIWRHAEVERWPILGEMLARRQALRLGPRYRAGEEFALGRPALFAARQLAVDWRFILVGHVFITRLSVPVLRVYSCRCIAELRLVSRMVE